MSKFKTVNDIQTPGYPLKIRATSTCATCGHRTDGPDSAYRDWEAARVPLENRIAALEGQLADLKALLGELDLEWIDRDEDYECGSYRSGPHFTERLNALLNPTNPQEPNND